MEAAHLTILTFSSFFCLTICSEVLWMNNPISWLRWDYEDFAAESYVSAATQSKENWAEPLSWGSVLLLLLTRKLWCWLNEILSCEKFSRAYFTRTWNLQSTGLCTYISSIEFVEHLRVTSWLLPKATRKYRSSCHHIYFISWNVRSSYRSKKEFE